MDKEAGMSNDEKREIDCELTDDVVCPYCGYVHSDSWEINFGHGLDGETNVSCDDCGKEFCCTRSITVYYTSTPIEAKQ